ncbi:RNA-directed DNA polymerase, eukaryota [Tanacetum coccineum]
MDIQEVGKRRHEEDEVNDNVMQIDEDDGEGDEEGNNEDGGSSDDKERSIPEMDGGSCNLNDDYSCQNNGEDEGSSYSGETRVRETFEEEDESLKKMATGIGEKGNEEYKKPIGKEGNDGLNVDVPLGREDGPVGLNLPNSQLNNHDGSMRNNRDQGTQANLSVRKDKRAVSPSSSVGSGGDHLKKKRKPFDDINCESKEFERVFNQGKVNEENTSNKKKVGRRSVTKARVVARQTRVKGLGENKKGISDIYKEFHEVEDEDSVLFQFGSKNEEACKNNRCKINMEHVKEVEGVDWRFVGFSRKREGEKGLISINVRGMGEAGKKGWVISIIKNEQPDVIGLQETKSGVVDDLWIEDIWRRKSYSYSQLPANGNSGGYYLNMGYEGFHVYGGHRRREIRSYKRLME